MDTRNKFGWFLTVVLVTGVSSSGELAPGVFVPAQATPVVRGMGCLDFTVLSRIDSLSASNIDNLESAKSYVRQAASLCGIGDSALLADDFESRLAAGELDTAKDPGRLVTDDQVAEAFNFMSDEFRVPHPVRLTASDILQWRSAMSGFFPHLFSPKSLGGSRPVGAVVMLRMLVYNGGITAGIRGLAQKDPPPGSLKLDPSSGRLSARSSIDKDPDLIVRGYQTAPLLYFQRLSPQEIRSFLDRLAKIIALPGGE
jgi:hypothetical protein